MKEHDEVFFTELLLNDEVIAVTVNFNSRGAAFAFKVAWKQALAKLERQRLEIITGEKVEDADAAWLVNRLGRDGALGANELALLRFLKDQSPVLPSVLSDMADRVGNAA